MGAIMEVPLGDPRNDLVPFASPGFRRRPCREGSESQKDRGKRSRKHENGQMTHGEPAHGNPQNVPIRSEQ